jgi:DNA polymerase I-like protein with 3'-5' exonuclease and polymerase domains
MLDLYRRGADIHAATAAAVMGISLEEFNQLPSDIRDHKRFQAKAVNFGFLYGMGWRKFITYAKTEYDIVFTEEEAQQIQNAFFRLYSALRGWHGANRQYVRDNGFVRSLDGRVRHLPSVNSDDEAIASGAERMAINSPVQGFGSDLGLIALRILVDTVSFSLVRPIGFIHDAIVCLVPEAKAKEAAAAVKQVMENLPLRKMFGLQLPVPIVADASVGHTLADTIEIKGDWFKDDNVITFADIRYKDWQARCAKAKSKGEPMPVKSWVPHARKKPLAARGLPATIAGQRKLSVIRSTNARAETKDTAPRRGLKKPQAA